MILTGDDGFLNISINLVPAYSPLTPVSVSLYD